MGPAEEYSLSTTMVDALNTNIANSTACQPALVCQEIDHETNAFYSSAKAQRSQNGRKKQGERITN